jgi:hypothetical protein
MRSTNLICSSLLRAFQMLFAIVVLGLSTALLKTHNDPLVLAAAHWLDWTTTNTPAILPLAVAVGSLSLVAAIFNLTIAWTDFLREYIEMLIDMVVIGANLVAGTVSIYRTPNTVFCINN